MSNEWEFLLCHILTSIWCLIHFESNLLGFPGIKLCYLEIIIFPPAFWVLYFYVLLLSNHIGYYIQKNGCSCKITAVKVDKSLLFLTLSWESFSLLSTMLPLILRKIYFIMLRKYIPTPILLSVYQDSVVEFFSLYRGNHMILFCSINMVNYIDGFPNIKWFSYFWKIAIFFNYLNSSHTKKLSDLNPCLWKKS